MKLECEDKPPIENASVSQVKRTISRLKSYGPCSFASLSDDNGNYLQVAGGRVTCMIEKRDALSGRHFRAYQKKRSEVFEDGTMLVFGGGKIKLLANEWFTSSDVEEVFLAFLNKKEMPDHVKWRDITGTIEINVN